MTSKSIASMFMKITFKSPRYLHTATAIRDGRLVLGLASTVVAEKAIPTPNYKIWSCAWRFFHKISARRPLAGQSLHFPYTGSKNMKWMYALLILYILLPQEVKGQDSVALRKNPVPTISIGAYSSNSFRERIDFRVGIRNGQIHVFAGIHRLIDFSPSFSNAQANIQINPWPVGIDFWIRRYLPLRTLHTESFLLFSLAVSRSNVDENPRYFPDPQRLGAWMYFEPWLWNKKEFWSSFRSGFGSRCRAERLCLLLQRRTFRRWCLACRIDRRDISGQVFLTHQNH
jgi:hypothetical protein